MHIELFKLAALDSAGLTGPTKEITQAIAMEDNNAAQMAVIMVVLTATNVSVQTQVSFDGKTWDNQGSAKTVESVGRQKLALDSAISAPFLRFEFSITGTGKAIFSADAGVSAQ